MSNSKKVIAIFTGNRAEYGLQFPIIKAVSEHPDLDYKLIISGAHLDTNFGQTLDEIKNDGFNIYSEISITMDANSLDSNVQAIGSGVVEIGKVLSKLRPDIMVVYADRFEGLAAVIASTQMNIPTVHIEGGDLTEGGALDDSVRHAMTKLSHLHFTTNQQATNRVLAMGEEAWRVHTVGFPAIDMINDGNYAKIEEIKSLLNLDLKKPIILFTQHSVTTEFNKSKDQIRASLKALEKHATEGAQVLITYPNNDAGGSQIINEIETLKKQNLENIHIQISLGRYLYHGLLALAKYEEIKIVCVGNSSSGIKETPVFGCPTINIGSRQEGRLRGENVIDVGYEPEAIYKAINDGLNSSSFRDIARNTSNPYYIGDAGKKIAETLATLDINQKLLRKKMTIRGETKEGWFR